MGHAKLHGMGIALITPFKADKSIDFKALATLIDYQIMNGADYLVVLGTTAETPTLTTEERREVREFVANRVNGRVPLVLGLGGNSTTAVVEELKNTDLSSFCAILSVTPYYNKKCHSHGHGISGDASGFRQPGLHPGV